MTKKILACLLALVLLLSLAACSSAPAPATDAPGASAPAAEETAQTETGEVSHDELYTIEMFNTYANYMGVQGGWFGKILKDKFNIELNIIAPQVAGTGDTLYQTRSAAGNLGDIIIQPKARMVDCYQAGLLANMSPYLEDCANLQKLSVAYDSMKELMGTEDVYAIPGRVSNASPTKAAGRGVNPEQGIFLRWDAYMSVGAPEVETPEEDLVALLYKMQDENPTNKNGDKVYAFSAFPDWDGNTVRAAREMLYLYGYGNAQGYYWMTYDGSDVVSLLDDGGIYYRWLKIFNKAYRDGYFDPDSSTQTWDMIASKAKDGRVLFSWWTFLGTNIHSTSFDPERQYGYGWVTTKDTLLSNVGYNRYGLEGNAYAMGKNAKYPERIMEFLDWLASEEGILYFNALVEGVTYEMVDGQPVLTEFGLDGSDDKVAPESMGGGDWSDGSCQINYPLVHVDDNISLLGGVTGNSALWESTLTNQKNAYSIQWEELNGTYSPLEYLADHDQLVVVPGTDYSAPADPSDIQTMRAQLQEITKAAGWQMIYAASDEEFESIWTEMKAQLPDFGLDEVNAYDMEIVDAMIAARQEVLK